MKTQHWFCILVERLESQKVFCTLTQALELRWASISQLSLLLNSFSTMLLSLSVQMIVEWDGSNYITKVFWLLAVTAHRLSVNLCLQLQAHLCHKGSSSDRWFFFFLYVTWCSCSRTYKDTVKLKSYRCLYLKIWLLTSILTLVCSRLQTVVHGDEIDIGSSFLLGGQWTVEVWSEWCHDKYDSYLNQC